MGEPTKCHLVDQLRWCIENSDDDAAWTRFRRAVNRIVEPAIYAGLRHAPGGPPTASRQRFVRVEMEDLKQAVWLRLIDPDFKALRRFRGDRDGSLKAYLARIAITVVQNYSDQPAIRTGWCKTVSLDELPEESATGSARVYSLDGFLEAALQVWKILRILQNDTPEGAAVRQVRILQLRLEGRSLAEIRRALGDAISKQAIGKIIAQQNVRIRRAMTSAML